MAIKLITSAFVVMGLEGSKAGPDFVREMHLRNMVIHVFEGRVANVSSGDDPSASGPSFRSHMIMRHLFNFGLLGLLTLVGVGVWRSLAEGPGMQKNLLTLEMGPVPLEQRQPLPPGAKVSSRAPFTWPENMASSLLVLKDHNCSQKSFQELGTVVPHETQELADQLRVDSFLEIRLSTKLTRDELLQRINDNPCVQALAGPEPFASLQHPQPQHIIDATAVLEAPRVFLVGAEVPNFPKLDSLKEPAEIRGLPFVSAQTTVYAYPVPEAQDVVSLNNQILLSVAHGADLILLQEMDPRLVAVATRIAAEQGARLQFLPDQGLMLGRGPAGADPTRVKNEQMHQ